MVRHRTIHENGPRTTRRRCHTACESCRDSHEKCNGENPCDICCARKQKCEYKKRSQRVSQAASSVVANSSSTILSDGGDGQPNIEAQKETSDTSAPLGSSWSESRVTACQSEQHEFDATDQLGDAELLQAESLTAERDGISSSRCMDFVHSGVPEILTGPLPVDNHGTQTATSERRASDNSRWPALDDPLYHTPIPDRAFEEMHQQSDFDTDVMQTESQFFRADGLPSPNFLHNLLPEFPQISMGEGELVGDAHGFPNGAERNFFGTALLPDADNMLFQLTDSDFFPFIWPDPTFNPPLPKSIPIRKENTPICRDSQQPLAVIPSPASSNTSDSLSWTFSGGSRKDLLSKQKSLIQELVDYAVTATDIPQEERHCYWESASNEVCNVFGLCRPQNSEDCILATMVQLYKQNLLPLWPMVCEKGLEDPTSLHPVLFLVAVSAGAMYLDQNASVFGVLMHKHLRIALITSFIEKEITEPDTIWLAQARNTIQVVSLYFGEGLGLTYAQHLGAVLVSQSRRMNLFRRSELEEFPSTKSPEDQIATWVRAETRRRVAFGIFRADVFMSLLMNCPPSISADELEIPLPYPDHLWHSIGKIPPQEMLAKLECYQEKRDETLFCDLVRIVLDRDEVLLNMETRHYELLLFGLQTQVWRFSHDPDTFQRLIGRSWQEEGPMESMDAEIRLMFNHSTEHSATRDHLQMDYRDMKDLVLDRRRLTKALEKWNQSFNASRFQPGFNQDRGSILSSLLLFHIYHLQLNASLDVLHQIADDLCSKKAVDGKKLHKVVRWTQSAQAKTAAHHASKIWSLLDNEARMNPMKKARYTMLSFMGLYHASVVLWTCYGSRTASEQRAFSAQETSEGGHSSRAHDILNNMVFLYQRLKCMNWDVFAESVQRLSRYQFPRDQGR